MSQVPLNIGFREALTGNRGARWLHLVSRLMDINLSTQPDTFVWNLTTLGKLTVKSFYLDFINDHTPFLKSIFRKSSATKIRIFMWFLHRATH
jgi:hypothetical protein